MATSFNYYKFYDVEDYIKKLFECKIYINTLSPINLVSPRYFETFASNSILLCEKSNVYNKIFEGELKYFTFDKDLKNFNDQVYSLLNDYGNISDIISNNKKCVYNNHTWENRVIKVIDLINKR